MGKIIPLSYHASDTVRTFDAAYKRQKHFASTVDIIRFFAAVDCGAQPILLHSIPVINALQTTTYGAKVAYKCIDGHWFGRYRYAEVATCTADGQWESGGETDPSRMPSCIRKLSSSSSL